MKIINITKYSFVVIGLAMLAGAFAIYHDINSFLIEAIKGEGTVVNLAKEFNSSVYKPVIQFKSRDGRTVEFTSSTGSSPPRYTKGQRVEVLYRPTDPYDAKISGFSSLWAGPTAFAGLGAGFLAVGTGIILVGSLRRRKEAYLRRHGTPIETDFQSVEQNTSLSVNGRHPFRVLTQWQSPTSSELHVFESSNLWFDPTNYIKTKKITVYIERNNPKKYFVDLSFLPKLAN